MKTTNPTAAHTPLETLECIKDSMTGDELNAIEFYRHERLFASAPELLAALEAAEDLMHFASLNADKGSVIHAVLAQARAAIARAKGVKS